MKNKGLVPSVVEGFTLIEILVVITIIALLATIGIGSYSTVTKLSADSRRKADLEDIRAALEMYKANNGSYPKSPASPPTSDTIFQDAASNIYMQKVPKDPKSPTYIYVINVAVDGTTYTLGTYIENEATSGNVCGVCGSTNCNYCLTPYGRK